MIAFIAPKVPTCNIDRLHFWRKPLGLLIFSHLLPTYMPIATVRSWLLKKVTMEPIFAWHSFSFYFISELVAASAKYPPIERTKHGSKERMSMFFRRN